MVLRQGIPCVFDTHLDVWLCLVPLQECSLAAAKQVRSLRAVFGEVTNSFCPSAAMCALLLLQRRFAANLDSAVFFTCASLKSVVVHQMKRSALHKRRRGIRIDKMLSAGVS
jgi:hypothetical protein